MGNLPALADRVNRIRNGMAATNVTDNDRNLEKSQVGAPPDAASLHADELEEIKARVGRVSAAGLRGGGGAGWEGQGGRHPTCATGWCPV